MLLCLPASVYVFPSDTASAKQIQAEYLQNIVYSPSGFANIMQAYSDGVTVTYVNPNQVPANARWVSIAPFISQLDEGVEIYFSRDGITTEKRFVQLDGWSDFPADARWLTVSNFDGGFGERNPIYNQEFAYSVDGITVQRGSEVPANALWATLSSFQTVWGGELKTLDYSRSFTTFTLNVDEIQTVTIGSDAANSSYVNVGDSVTLSFTTIFPLQNPVVKIAGHEVNVTQEHSHWTAAYTLTSADMEGLIPFQIDYEEEDTNIRKSITLTTDGSFVHFDQTPPSIVLKQEPDTWTNQNVRISATITDDGSGIIEQKWAKGVREAEFFHSAGNIYTGDHVMVSDPGFYSWYAKDQAGNEAIKTIEITNIDRTAPALHYHYPQDEWTKGPIQVSVTAEDTESGVQQLKWAEGEQSLSYFRTGGTDITDGAFFVYRNGMHTLYTSDHAGNEKAEVITIDRLDHTPPSITLTPSITAPTNGDVTITVSTSDAESGVAEQKWAKGEQDIAYFADNGELLPEGGSGADVSFSVSENATYTVYAQDRVGNEIVESLTVANIYKTVPMISLSSSPDTWTNQSINVSVHVTTDQGIVLAMRKWAQGEQEIEYFETGGQLIHGSDFSVTENGMYSVFVQDEAGNKAVQSIEITKIDQQPPMLHVTLDPAPDTWTNEPVTVHARAEDNSGEIEALKWSVGTQDISYFKNGNGSAFSDSFSVAENSVYTIYAEDRAGNGTVKTVEIRHIDTDIPEIQLSFDPVTVTNRNVIVSADVSDATSYITEQKWALGEQPIAYFEAGGTPFQDSFEAELNGVYTVFAKDAAGNKHIQTIEITNIHKEIPVIQLTLFPTAPTQGHVTVTAAVYSQIELEDQKIAFGWHDTDYFQTEGEPWVDELEVKDNGWLSFYVKDLAGNKAVKQVEITNIDREKPVITLNGQAKMSLMIGSDFIDPGALAVDNLDGDLTEQIAVTGEVNPLVAGEYTLQYNVTDTAGNAADEVVRIVTVLPRPPVGGGEDDEGRYPPDSGTKPKLPDTKLPGTENKPKPPKDTICSEDEAVQCQTEEALPFSDLQGHWARKEISHLAGSKVIKGYPDGTFRPDRIITRAEFAALLVDSLGLELKHPNPFQDINEHWARDRIAAAKQYGIINGYGTEFFAPNDPLTREQMAMMLVQAYLLTPKGENVVLSYNDHSQVAVWAQEAVQIVMDYQIMEGFPGGYFQPKGFATRAEGAVVLYRVQHLLGINTKK